MRRPLTPPPILDGRRLYDACQADPLVLHRIVARIAHKRATLNQFYVRYGADHRSYTQIALLDEALAIIREETGHDNESGADTGVDSSQPALHCWTDGPPISRQDGTQTGTTCLLEVGHLGPHEWTSDDRITIDFRGKPPLQKTQEPS